MDIDTQAGRDCWTKIEQGELNGFSIGAPPPVRRVPTITDGTVKNRITYYRIAELSLVDNPAVPSAYFTMVKSADHGGMGTVVSVHPALGSWKEGETPLPSGEDVPSGLRANAFVDPAGGVWKQAGKLAAEGRKPTMIQTLIFDKGRFDADKAKSWARSHDFDSGKVDETSESLRLRQRDPGDFAEGSFRTIELADGVKAVIGHLREPKTSEGKEAAMQAPVSAPAATPETGRVVGPSPTGPIKPQETPSGKLLPTPDDATKAAEAEATAKKEAEAKEAEAKKAAEAEAAKKAAEHKEPNGDECPDPSAHAMGKSANYAYCASCGAKQVEGAKTPFHDKCAEAMKKAAQVPAGQEGMEKAMSAILESYEGMLKARDTKIEELSSMAAGLVKRLEKLEAQPASGGPMRTEIPAGFTVVQKGAEGNPLEEGAQAIAKAAQILNDPALKSGVNRAAALAMIRHSMATK